MSGRFLLMPSSPVRPPIERYIRCSVDIPGGSIEVGLQHCPNVSREFVRAVVRDAYFRATAMTDLEFSELADLLTNFLEHDFASTWPTRAWFVEIWNEREALSQVYQPYGMPRVFM